MRRPHNSNTQKPMFDFNRIIPPFISRRLYLDMLSRVDELGADLNAACDKIEEAVKRYEALHSVVTKTRDDLKKRELELDEALDKVRKADIRHLAATKRCETLEKDMEEIHGRYDAMVATTVVDKERIRVLGSDVERLMRERDAIKDNIVQHIKRLCADYRVDLPAELELPADTQEAGERNVCLMIQQRAHAENAFPDVDLSDYEGI